MASSDDKNMDRFMRSIRKAGFNKCPICGNDDGFSWAHSSVFPTGEKIEMTAFIPGATTVPGQPKEHKESFPTPLIMLICDRCSHIMIFSRTMYLVNTKDQVYEK